MATRNALNLFRLMQSNHGRAKLNIKSFGYSLHHFHTTSFALSFPVRGVAEWEPYFEKKNRLEVRSSVTIYRICVIVEEIVHSPIKYWKQEEIFFFFFSLFQHQILFANLSASYIIYKVTTIKATDDSSETVCLEFGKKSLMLRSVTGKPLKLF